MFERFTDRARKVMAMANEEAKRFNHGHIGTDHILLGLIKEGSGMAASSLKNLNIDLQTAKSKVEEFMKVGPNPPSMERLPREPTAKKVIELAIVESRHLGHNYVGTEHLLLGLLREPDGVGGTVLRNMGLELKQVRNDILETLGTDNQTAFIYPIADRTPEVQHVWQHSIGEANKMGNQAVCTGHILLSLLAEDKSIASRLLKRVGLTAEMVREEIVKTDGRESGD